MQVKKIEAYFEAYKKFLRSREGGKRLFVWESQKVFQENWNLEAMDLEKMFDDSLQNRETRRLWNRESYEPKTMMKHFARLQPIYFRQMFTDFFAEGKSIDGRLGRFVFYCDELFDLYKEAFPHGKENTHYHDDGYEMASLYLSFRHPANYCPYRLDLFQELLKRIGAKNPPLTHDTARYFKVCQTLWKLMQKDTVILDLHQKRLNAERHYLGESLLLIYDFNCFVASHKIDS